MITDPEERLSLANRYLAEVIDECVFLERQQRLTEERLGAQVATQKRNIELLLRCLQQMGDYCAVMETTILIPAVGAANPSASKTVLDAKTKLLDAMEEMRKVVGVGAGESTATAAPFLPASSAARTETEALSREEAARVVAGLCNEREALLSAVRAARRTMQDVSWVGANAVGEDVHELRKNMRDLTDSLRLHYRHVVQETSKNPPRTSPLRGTDGCVQSELDSLGLGTPTVDRMEARIRAYEKTVAELNNEVILLQDKCDTLSLTTQREIEQAKEELTGERKRHQEQLQQSEAIMGHMAMELEQLVQENAQLKQRIRDLHERKR